MGESNVGHSMIGQILRSLGRITEQDVEAALAHQQARGGYFGEALLALGLVTPDELDWGLTSQFDIPYVFPGATTVDENVARLVTSEWAMRHLTLPVVRTSDTLHVIVDSPTWSEALEELEAKTGLKVELGLASREKVHELIWGVFGEGEPPVPTAIVEQVTVEELADIARSLNAGRFGISIRDGEITGWYEESDGRIGRLRMTSDSRTSLDRLLTPGVPNSAAGAQTWTAQLATGDAALTVEATHLSASAGEEFLFRIS